MTSRAVLAIDLNAVRNYGDHEIIRRRAVMLRPAHIVFDGFRYLGKSEVTLVANTQPRLDATWKVTSPTDVVIKSFPLSHDDIMAKSTAAQYGFWVNNRGAPNVKHDKAGSGCGQREQY